MSAETITKDVLTGSAGVTALVSVRIWPDELPQKTAKPAITFERQGDQREYTLDNTLAATKVSMAVTGWAATRASANAVGAAIVAAFAAAGMVCESQDAVYVPELDEYAAVVVAEVWE